MAWQRMRGMLGMAEYAWHGRVWHECHGMPGMVWCGVICYGVFWYALVWYGIVWQGKV